MKIRRGFVSNSSSSSFIISALESGYETTASTALTMIGIIAEEYNEYNDWGSNKDKTWIEVTEDAIFYLLENPDYDDPIKIPWSCNYETYIWKSHDRKIYVDTCNNHDWSDIPKMYEGGGYDEQDTVHQAKPPEETFLNLRDLLEKEE